MLSMPAFKLDPCSGPDDPGLCRELIKSGQGRPSGFPEMRFQKWDTIRTQLLNCDKLYE